MQISQTHARETLGLLQRGQVGRGQFSGFSFQILQTATPVSRQASKIAEVVSVQLASPSVFFQRIQTLILNLDSQLASDLVTAYRSVLHRVQVEGHIGEQGDVPLVVGLLLSDVLEPIRPPHALQHHQRVVENQPILRGVVILLFSGFDVAQNKAKHQVDLERISLSTEDGPQHVANVTSRLQSLSMH